MSEYISREAAERAAHMAFVRRNDALQYSEMIHQLAKIPAADVRPVEWIPVTERLPEVRTWVLCYCRANSFDVFRMTDEGHWQYGNRSIYMKGYVTHWMPLPEPPKEE